MTINSTTRKAGPFVGTGTVSAFSFGFKVFQASDLFVVRLNVSAAVEQTLVLNSDYSVTLNPDQNSNPGGVVTLLAGALASGYTLTLTSDVPDTQPTDLTNQGGFYPEVINDALDRATIQIQQLQEETDRTITAPISTPAGTDLTFPLPSANKFIGWNSTATGLQNLDNSTLASIVAFATAYADTFNGDGATSTFVLSYPPATVRNLDVSINGVTQVPVVDYNISGQALNFTTPPPLGSVVLAKYWQALPNSSGAAQDFTLNPNGYTTAVDVQEGFDDLGSSAGTSKVGFLQAGIGAQARTAQAKLRDVVSVDDFGAVGDGVTDDSAAINAALAAFPLVKTAAGKTYAVGSSVVVPINTTFDMTGSDIIPLSPGSFTPITEEPTYSAIIIMNGVAAKINGGRINMAGSSNLAAVYFREFQQKATLVTVNNGEFGFYGRNHSCIFLNNVFNYCAVGIKGITNDFNGNQINDNTFEECDICVELENRVSSMSSCFIRGNLFNLYKVNGVSCNSVSNDMIHLVIEQNYFESPDANNKAIRLYGSGAFPSVFINRNISFGATATSYFVHLESAGAIVAEENSVFQHAYGFRSASFSGQFVAKNNYLTNVTTPYTYERISGAVEINDYNFSSTLGSQTRLLKVGPQIYAGANAYDIGATMNGTTTASLTDVTGTSVSNIGKYCGAGSSLSPVNTQSVFTDYVARDLKFDMQVYLGDGWRAELTCRQNPGTLADYYALGVRLTGGTTYQFVLQVFGSTPGIFTQVTTALPSNPLLWGVRGRVVGQYFYLESYDTVTGATLDSHTFTDANYTIGLAGMFCNSSDGANNSFIRQMFIGPC